MISATLSHYRILKKIGQGGMGEVYLAEDLTLGRSVALKVLPPELAGDPDRVRRLQREARTLSALNHPHIVTIHELGREGDLHFMVTEFVEGRTLRERLGTPISLSEAIDIALAIARAMRVAHESGILHRDLKPENIMIRHDGVVKLLDFGIAHVLEGMPSTSNLTVTDEGSLVGTVPYMSPEQLRLSKLDARTDIFSLGVVLYEMLSGRFPFEAPSVAETMAAILERDPPPLLPVAGENIPESLAGWVTAALKKNPAERPDLSELISVLEMMKRELDWKREMGRSASFRAAIESHLSTARRELPRPARRAPETSPINLPAAMTPLIGRESELEALVRLLFSEGTRLVTLTGPGGSGKTRLALEAARAAAGEFVDGVFFVPLVDIRDPSLVLATISQHIGAPSAPDRSPADSLRDYLRPKELLLVIDNFEQVLDAAAGIAELLASCPGLTVMTTSQSPLHLRGEREFFVRPLALPKSQRLEDVRATPAVTLFVERARDVNSDFSLNERNAQAIVEICRQLDGLPLAIELAAARIKILSAEEILEKLQKPFAVLTGGARDLPERQRTLRKAIEWSYAPLTPAEKSLYRRLSVFRGGCTLEAAEQVCWWGDRPADLLETFSALIDRSLVKREEQTDGESRFSMLETIRAFAAELLSESGEENEVRQRHAAWFAQLAERVEPELSGPAEALRLRALTREHHNIREAIEWSIGTGPVDVGLRIASALRLYWILRGNLAEARDQLERLISKSSNVEIHLRVKALYTAGVLADTQGDFAAARQYFQKNLEIHRSLGDAWGIANSLNNLGIIALREHDYAGARALYEESLGLWRQLGNQPIVALSLQNLGNVARLDERHADALRHYQESLALFREIGDDRGVARCLSLLADLARSERRLAEARELYEESLQISMRLSDHWDVGNALADLGHVARLLNDRPEAYSLYEESLLIFRELGDHIGAARLLEAHAVLAVDEQQPERALLLAAAASALRGAVGARPSVEEQFEMEASLAKMREVLGEKRAEEAWRAGSGMSLEEAVALVERPQG